MARSTPAPQCAGPRRYRRRRAAARVSASLLLGAVTATAPEAASAEPGFSLNAATDDRFRGRSISGERPVATALASYDDVRGPYAGVSITAVATRDDGLQLLRSVQYVGYAHRLRGGLTLDAGVVNRSYTRYFTGAYGRTLTEGYVGLVGRRVSGRVYVSPDFDGRGGNSAYAELDALLLERGRWSLSSHLGVLALPAEPGEHGPAQELDWRVGATRSFGRLALTLQWTGSGPDHDTRRWQSGAVLSATRSF